VAADDRSSPTDRWGDKSGRPGGAYDSGVDDLAAEVSVPAQGCRQGQEEEDQSGPVSLRRTVGAIRSASHVRVLPGARDYPSSPAAARSGGPLTSPAELGATGADEAGGWPSEAAEGEGGGETGGGRDDEAGSGDELADGVGGGGALWVGPPEGAGEALCDAPAEIDEAGCGAPPVVPGPPTKDGELPAGELPRPGGPVPGVAVAFGVPKPDPGVGDLLVEDPRSTVTTLPDRASSGAWGQGKRSPGRIGPPTKLHPSSAT
jgi:hypothetical protein